MTTTVNPAGRDRDTGELLNKISITIYVKGEILPRLVYCRDWTASRRFLASADFKSIADSIEHLTITNRKTA